MKDEENEYEDDSESIFEIIGRVFRVTCLTIVILIIVAIVTLILKPSIVMKPLAGFLNAGKEISSELSYDSSQARQYLEDQLNVNLSQTTVRIPEDVFTAIGREEVKDLKNLYFDIEEGQINIYWDLISNEEYNLLGYAKLSTANKSTIFTDLEIEKLGFPRITLPKALQRAIFNTALSVLDVTGENPTGESLIFKILGSSTNYEILEISIVDDELILLLNTDLNFYD